MTDFEGSNSVQEYNLFPHLVREGGVQALNIGLKVFLKSLCDILRFADL